MAEERQVEIRKSSFSNGLKIFLAVVAVLFLMFVTFAAGAAMGAFAGYSDWGSGHRHMMDGKYGYSHMRSGDFWDSKDMARGTVTSAKGGEFVVAGHGSTTTVKTDSSTEYRGGNEVKTNDTVVVWGQDSDGTLKADTVVINP